MSRVTMTAAKRSKQACALCGRDPAAGFAGVGGDRYCHGDDDPEPTCYMQAQRDLVPPLYAAVPVPWDRGGNQS